MRADISTSTCVPELAAARSTCRLLVVYSPTGLSEGRARVLVDGSPQVFGRDERSGLSLEEADHKLSREHFTLQRLEQGWQLRDQSRNGSFVNGKAISEHWLQPSDVVRVGDHLLLYQEIEVAAALALLSDQAQGSTLLGRSPELALLRQHVGTVGPLPQTVLLLGETGVGKEVLARALHLAGGPAERPFVGVNCAALGADTIEAELFGHTRGAFTGAAQARLGLFREAEGGTLFLDEIGELPPLLQAKLLRALDSREVRPLGSDQSVPFSARILAATNRDVKQEIAGGSFRSDLFARLMTHVIEIPPLRARKEDVLLLLGAFLLADGAAKAYRPTPDAAEALLAYAWPRNVRELRQLATRLGPAAQRAASIELERLPRELQEGLQGRRVGEPLTPAVPHELLEIPRDRVPTQAELSAVLAAFDGNVSRVASFFGKDRRQIYRWCERFGMQLSEP